jgi:quercetin dioxygenase-like cupin family protein
MTLSPMLPLLSLRHGPARTRAAAFATAIAATALAAAGVLALMPSAQRASTARWLTDLCSAAGRPMFSSAPVPAGVASPPQTATTPLSCEALPNVPGKSVTTVTVDFPPQAFSAPHRHPGSVTAVVLEGTIRSQLQGGPVVDYKPGQTWFEPPRTLHLVAGNPDPTHPAKLLAFFVTDDNCGPLVIPEPPQQ